MFGMFTTTKPKMASILTSSSQQSSSTPCKSCAKCQEIYDSLSSHIMSDHALASANDSVLNNVLLSILSLMSGNASEAPVNPVPNRSDESSTRQEENNLAPVTVISKAEKPRPIQPTKDQVTSNTYSPSNVSQLPQNTNIANISNDINNTPINNPPDMPNRLSFQPDLISLFSSLPQQQKIQDVQSLTSNRQHLIQPKLLQVQDSLDISFMVPPNSDFQTAAGLIAPDGSITPAGISFLLANQNKSVNASGKSDLDVADILVNKMPIPSLNKALDPSLLQLSTLYLQQIAMNQQQSNLSNGNSATPVDFTSELMNIAKSEETQNQNISKTTGKHTSSDNEPAESIQILVKHKQISGLIEALSTQQKNATKPHVKAEAPYDQLIGSSTTYTINPQGQLESSVPGISLVHNNRQTIPVSGFTLRQATPAATIKTNPNGKSNYAVASSTSKKGIPIMWDQVSSNLINLVKQQPTKSTTNDESEVHFQQSKHGDAIQVDPIASSKPSELQALQNLIIEHPKSIVVVADSKNNESAAQPEPEAKIRLSTVSMVPISQSLGTTVATESKNTGHVGAKSKLLYKCNVCGITFSVVSTLQAHLKTHVVEKKEQCNYCQMSFVNKDEYYEHVLSHRGEENVFTCQFCQTIFTSKGDYNKHVTKHTQRRPYLCSHCHKAFRDPGSLTKHERIHTGEQPYVCDICERGFAEKSSLRKHVRVHSGEQPYKCNQCDKSFSISGNLQRHLFIHTGLRPFKCTECSKAFNNPSHLRRHVKNLHKKVEGAVVAESKPANNNLVFPRIMNSVVAEARREESMKTD